jgi:hypothetical protein
VARIDHEAQKEPVREEVEFLNLPAYWLFLRFVVNSSHPFGGLSIFIHSGQISPHVCVAFCSSWSFLLTLAIFAHFGQLARKLSVVFYPLYPITWLEISTLSA